MPVTGPWAYAAPILLHACSNVFMTLAWYGHLNIKERPMLLVIVAPLGNCLHRVLPRCSSQSLWPRRLFRGAAQDHSGW
jgi:uncharacterized protein (DUF486 family)